MNADQFKAMMAAYVIDRKHALYLQTGNPIHAWSAYDNARKLDVAIPDWVLGYFDVSAEALISTAHASAKAIADALRLGDKGGRLVTRLAEECALSVDRVRAVYREMTRPPKRGTPSKRPA